MITVIINIDLYWIIIYYIYVYEKWKGEKSCKTIQYLYHYRSRQ